MKSFSLAPYNWYILLAAFVLLVVFAIITLKKASPAIRQLKEWQPDFESIKTGAGNAKIKADIVTSKAGSDLKKSGKLIIAILTFGWAYNQYKEKDQKGIKEFRRSEKEVRHTRGWQLDKITDKINEIGDMLEGLFNQ